MESNKFGYSQEANDTEAEVDCSKLILTSKNYISKTEATEEELKLGEFYLKLALLLPYMDDYNMIWAQANLSFLYNKMKDPENVIAIGVKMLRFLLSYKSRELESTSVLFLIKIFYRSGVNASIINNLFLSARFLYESKEMLDHPKIDPSMHERQQIQSIFNELLESISKSMTEIKQNLSSNPENIDKIKEIVKNIKTYPQIQNKEEKFYLVSSRWISKLISFLNRFTGNNRIDMIPALCDRNKTLIQHFDDDSNSRNSKPAGYYPGPIHNISILDFLDYWKDPEENEKYTLSFLQENLRENSDYLYLDKDSWNNIKSTFNYDYEIERRVTNLNGEEVIEVNLRKVKL